MGKLIIHIDQDSGAVIKVEQELVPMDRIAMNNKRKDFVEDVEKEEKIFANVLNMLEKEQPETARCIMSSKSKIDEWLTSDDEKSIIVTLEPLGDLYNSEPELVKALKEHRDTFDRIVNLPIEFWERTGQTLCTNVIGGVPRRCWH